MKLPTTPKQVTVDSSDLVRSYIQKSVSENTRRAYQQRDAVTRRVRTAA